MEPAEILKKVHAVEAEVLEIKSLFPPPRPFKRFLLRLKKILDSVLKYWLPLALLLGLFINWWYGVGFFDEIKDAADKKRAAQYYVNIGNALLMRAEFKAAEEAFVTALDIKENDLDAHHGRLRLQVLNPVKDRKTYTPEIVEAKLAYLGSEESPLKNDFLIPYYRGVMSKVEGKRGEARKSFNDSKALEDKFAGNYIQLGHLDVYDGNLKGAIANFEEALRKAKSQTLVLTYLGACQMASLDFDKAQTSLEEAEDRADRLETLLFLGELYRWKRDFVAAHIVHERALELTKDPAIQEGAHYDPCIFTFMPERRGDTTAAYVYNEAHDLGDFKSLIYYALSLDYALAKDMKRAQSAFDEAYKIDRTVGSGKRFRCLYKNRIGYIKEFSKVDAPTVRWLEERLTQLDPGRECSGL